MRCLHMTRRSRTTGASSSKHLRAQLVCCNVQVGLPATAACTAAMPEVAGAQLGGPAATTSVHSSGDALSCKPDSQENSSLIQGALAPLSQLQWATSFSAMPIQHLSSGTLPLLQAAKVQNRRWYCFNNATVRKDLYLQCAHGMHRR